MERDEREGAGATRSQHVVYTLPQDWSTIPVFLQSALERVNPDRDETQLLVVTPDAESALAVAEAALALRPDARPLVVPVTSPARALRQLRARPAAVVAGSPDLLAALIRSSALKLDAVQALVLAWADEVAATHDAAELEAVLTEVPKDATRVLVAREATDEVDALIERYLRRPRRIATSAAPASPIALQYVSTGPNARPAALRRLLDEIDPVSAAIVVASDDSAAAARATLRALGEDPDALGAALVRVVRDEAPGDAELVVLYDVPADRAALERATSGKPHDVVTLAQPRQLATLRELAGGPVKPFALKDTARRARRREEVLRDELRATLAAGLPSRELLALEPLLEEFDGVELAAAALRLVERERARRTADADAARARPAEPLVAEPTGMTRLFVNIGSKDGARPGDLVGAITNEAGIGSDRIGKIDLRDTHAIVEVATADAARVVDRLNGIAIRGRRVLARTERERPGGGGAGGFQGIGGGERRGAERRGGFERGERPGRGERPARGGARGARGEGERRGSTQRGPAGGRERGFDARSDGPRGFGERDDRDPRERAEQRGEWADRGERLRRARPSRGDASAAERRDTRDTGDVGPDADV